MSEIPAETLAALAARVAAVHEQIAENSSYNAKQFAELRDMMLSLQVTLQGMRLSKQSEDKPAEIVQFESSVDSQPMDIAKDGDFAGKSSSQPQPVLPTPQTAPMMSPNQSSNTQESAMKHAQGEELHQVGHANTPFRMPRVDVPQFCGADGEEWLFQMAMGMSKVAEQKLNALRIPVHHNELIPECFISGGKINSSVSMNIRITYFGLFSQPRPPEFPTLRTRLSEGGSNVTLISVRKGTRRLEG